MAVANEESKFQRKKKGKSFLQKAKKFGKQGQRGKGSQIAQDQYDYLVRVMERWREPWESEEEKEIFVSNVMQQTEGEERVLCGNQLASRVIELILPYASPSVSARIAAALIEDLRLACMDPFMSHVLEKLLILSTFTKEGEQGNVKEEETPLKQTWMIKVCKFVSNNLEDFCQDTYASHILRTVVQCAVGQRYTEQHQKNKGGPESKQTEGYDLMVVSKLKDDENEQMDEVLDTLTARLMALPKDILTTELCVRVIQVYLSLVSQKQPKTARGVVRYLLTACFAEPDQVDWDDSSVVRLMEALVVAGINHAKLGPKLMEVLEGKVGELARHPTANFVVQRLLDQLTDKDRFLVIVEEVVAGLEEVLAAGATGVLLALTKSAVRLEAGQTIVMAAIIKVLHCNEKQEMLAPLLAHLVTLESWSEGEHPPVHLHGSLALQQLLLFTKPIKVVRSLLSLGASQLASLLADPRGCHITDSFLTSKHVGEKSREGLIRGLRGQFVSLACGKHGSRTVDALWKHSGMKMKQTMAEELSAKLDILNSNKFGKFVAQKCYLQVFKRGKEDWRAVLDKEEKVENMFSDILGDKNESGKGKVSQKRVAEEKVESDTSVPVKVAKTEISKSTVDSWLAGDSDEPKLVVKKKKSKAKSYLDDL